MKLDKDRISAITGTVIFHGVLLLLLLILALRTPLPLPGEEGVVVNIGYDVQGQGKVQQEQPVQKEEAAPPPSQPEQSQPEAKEEMLTQETDEAPALEDVKEEKTEEEKEEKDKEKPEPEKPEETKETEDKPEETKPDVPEKPKVNQKALYKGKDNSQESQDEGTTGEPGDEGSIFGDKESDNHEGEGGAGNGVSFSLSGRKSKYLPKPDYDSEDQGKVVVTIYVNRYGNVIRAVAGSKGTTVTDSRLQERAKNAAERAKFSRNMDAPEVQKGTITYNFIRMN